MEVKKQKCYNDMMHYDRHIVSNFPKNYPWWKKIMANIMFFFGGTIIHHRKNLLTNSDLKKAKKILEKGDVVLVGGLRRISGIAISGAVTHAMLYIGRRTFIHAVVDGIETDSLHDIFCEYDTMAILKPKNITKKQIKKAIKYAKNQIGKPFDFEFSNDHQKFYCSEFVYYSLKEAKVKTGLRLSASKTIHPSKFINDNFKILFLSHNLKFKNGQLTLK